MFSDRIYLDFEKEETCIIVKSMANTLYLVVAPSSPFLSSKFLSIQSARKLSPPIYILEYISLTSL